MRQPWKKPESIGLMQKLINEDKKMTNQSPHPLTSKFDSISVQLSLAQSMALILSSEDLQETHHGGDLTNMAYLLMQEIERISKDFNDLHTAYFKRTEGK